MMIGPYEVLSELGRGGMGVVYRVRASGGDVAALKLLSRAGPESLARFERERRLVAALGEEEGFVGLLDAGASAEGPWLVMPFVPGGTLRARLDAGPLGVDEAVALGIEVASALGRAHERGIVHRDVKPENILFTATRRPLVADLGLAKHFDRDARGASQSVGFSRTGAFKGTVGYTAPEQLEDASRAGPPADVFALGAVLYECLAGRPVFQGERVLDVLTKLSSGQVEPIGRPGVPSWIEPVLRRALAADPRERFAHGAALARALREGRGAKPALSRGATVPLVAGALAGVLVLAALLVVLRGRPPERRPAPSPPTKPAPPPARAESSATARQLVARGSEKFAAGDLDEAIADHSRAIELDPGLAEAWAYRAAAYGKKRDLDRALSDGTRAIELDPTLWAAWANRGTAHTDRGEIAEAIADDTRAIELAPRAVVVWKNRAAAYLEMGDLPRASADATKAIELDPAFAEAWLLRAKALRMKGDFDAAIADATRAIELAPGLAEPRRVRGAAFLDKGDLDAAIADLTKSLELDPGSARAWLDRGSALVARNRLDAGMADLTRALELDPTLARAWTLRGQVFDRQDKLDEALRDLTKAIELDPKQAPAWETRGTLRCRRRDFDAGIADLTKAIEVDPRYATAWTNRGTARLRKGDPRAAIADYERSLELSPTGADAAQVRGLLAQAKDQAAR